MRRSAGFIPTVAAAAIWVAVGGGALVARLPPYPAWLLGGTIATLSLYGYDKWQAGRQGWRVPERLLMVLALLGGVIGAWVGMFLFRHKTRHMVFYFANGIATAVQLVLAVWLFRR